MRHLIFDTDIGIDCDDVAALSFLLEYESVGKCIIDAITVSTTRVGATSAVKALLSEYNKENIPVGRRFGMPLECDKTNVYASAMMEEYGNKESTESAVKLLRRILSTNKTMTTIVAVGPLSNVAELLKSEPDEYSELDGITLVKEKVDELYVMGGNFVENTPDFDGEFNIKMDINAARYVAEMCPKDILFVPFECGALVYTNVPLKNTPLSFAMRTQAEYYKKDPDNFKRPSWDPVTCFCTLENFTDYFYFSKKVRVEIDDKGRTIPYVDEKGNARYLSCFAGYEEVAKHINCLFE